jgi:hypothetical protein
MADRAHLARVEELLRAYDLWDDTDTLKHALEDWQRWGAGIKSGVQPAVIERLVDKLVEAMLPLALPPPAQEYAGPITAGDHFIWEPDKPTAWCHIEVMRVEDRGTTDRVVWSRVVQSNRWNPEGQETWNDESRFREACRPCDARGVLLPVTTNA